MIEIKIVDHSVVVGAAPTGATSYFLTLGFRGLGKDKYKTGRETFMLTGFVRPVLEVRWYC